MRVKNETATKVRVIARE